jgi:hypothetical protein
MMKPSQKVFKSNQAENPCRFLSKLLSVKEASALFFFLFLSNLFIGCTPSNNLQTPFEKTESKIHLDQNRKEIEAKENFAVLVDRKCLQKVSKKRRLLTSHLNLGKLRKTQSKAQTIKWESKEKQSLKSFKEKAELDPCVLGVSEYRIAQSGSVATKKTETNSGGETEKTSFYTNASSENLIRDPLLEKQRHLKTIEAVAPSFLDRLNKWYDLEKHPILIAFVDNGIDLEHPELASELWVNNSEAQGFRGVDDDGNGYIDDIHGFNFASNHSDPSHETYYDHGTHVAGLAAAKADNGEGGMGVMGKGVRIMPLNVMGRYTGAETAHIDEAIRYAADHGAHIINISIGSTGTSPTTAAAIAYAIERGSFVVSSAGNRGSNLDSQFYFPASYAKDYQGFVAVGATNISGNKLCDDSNFSTSYVEIAAPGCDSSALLSGLLSTRQKSRFGYKKGTSMAAALVSGAAAHAISRLRIELEREPSPREIELFLLNHAQKISELGSGIQEGRLLSIRNLFD